jgi:hypothetical protein
MNAPWGPDEVRFELTSTEIEWLEEQPEFCSKTVVKILTSALEEWIPRNPNRFIGLETIAAITSRGAR